ncbi:MAG: hypothetical protein GF341_07485 [candidate division Zixibacteria bacterium]|nr:hypothetical protein [candidate division Zixibacteria bacterium]
MGMIAWVAVVGVLAVGCSGGASLQTATFDNNTPLTVIDVIDGEAMRASFEGEGKLGDVSGPIRPVSIAPTRANGLLIADMETRGILRIDGTNTVMASSVGPYVSRFNTRTAPRFVRTDLAGNVYAVDGTNEEIYVYDQDLVAITNITPPYRALGLPQGQLTGLAFGGYGEMYVADRLNSRVYRFDASGVQIGDFGSEEAPWARLNRPAGIACDDYDGSVYVCDLGERRIVAYDNTGALLRTFGQADLREPVAVAIDRSGHVFVADYSRRAILVYSREGEYLGLIDGPRLGFSEFGSPTDVAIRHGILHIADLDNQRIIKVRYARQADESGNEEPTAE